MESLEQRLRHQSMDWLAQREYSRHELAQKLEKRFFAANKCRSASVDETADSDAEAASASNLQLIFATLDWLEERQFLSDQRCARLHVRSHIERGHGALRIRQELVFIKRLAAELVASELEASGCDWFALAQTTLLKRFRRPPADLKEKAKQLRFLQQRGFTSEQCFYALERIDQTDN